MGLARAVEAWVEEVGAVADGKDRAAVDGMGLGGAGTDLVAAGMARAGAVAGVGVDQGGGVALHPEAEGILAGVVAGEEEEVTWGQAGVATTMMGLALVSTGVVQGTMECAAGGEGLGEGGGVLVVATIAVAATTCIAAMAPVSRREEVVAFSVAAAAREVGEAGAWEEELVAEAVAVVIKAAVAREVPMRKMVLGGKMQGRSPRVISWTRSKRMGQGALNC